MKKNTLASLLIVTLLFTLPGTVAASHLADIDGHKNQVAIEFLEEKGVIEGNPDGTFRPDTDINRAEILKILFLVSGDALKDPVEDCFPDVPASAWFAKYVCTAKELGHLEGYPDGLFRPENPINKVEALKLMAGFLEWNLDAAADESLFEDTDPNVWYAPYLRYAKKAQLIEETGNLYEPADNMLRGPVAETVFRSIVVLALEDEKFESSRLDDFFALVAGDDSGQNNNGESGTIAGEADLTRELALMVDKLADLNKSLFTGSEGYPKIKIPTIYFNAESTDFNYQILSSDVAVESTQILLYDNSYGGWVYGFNSEQATTMFGGNNIDDEITEYSFAIDRVKIVDEMLDSLENINLEKGFFIQVNLVNGASYLFGIEDVILIGINTLDKIGANIQELVTDAAALILHGGDCDCKDQEFNIAEALAAAFGNKNVDFNERYFMTGEPYKNDTSDSKQNILKCGNDMELTIRLSENFEVLPDHEEALKRYKETNRPQQGGLYLFLISITSYCNSDWECQCRIYYRVYNVETGVAIAGGNNEGLCKDLGARFGQLLDDLEKQIADYALQGWDPPLTEAEKQEIIDRFKFKNEDPVWNTPK